MSESTAPGFTATHDTPRSFSRAFHALLDMAIASLLSLYMPDALAFWRPASCTRPRENFSVSPQWCMTLDRFTTREGAPRASSSRKRFVKRKWPR